MCFPSGGATCLPFNLWYRFVRDLFIHRRKTLRAAIARVPGYKRLKPQLDEILAALQISGQARAEQLTARQLHDLFQALQVPPGQSTP